MADDLRGEPLLREMQRKSLDTICVYNPTSADYNVEWDGFLHLIPNKDRDVGFGKGKKHLPRYLAEKYAREMKNKLIHEMADKSLKDKMEEMTKKGVEEPLVKANLQFEINHGYRTDNPQLIKEIYAKVILGIVERYGMGDEEKKPEGEVADQRPVEEQILSNMDRAYTPNKPEMSKNDAVAPVEAAEPKYPINRSKKKMVEEVSA